LPTRKRVWQQLVKAKVRAQGNLLRELHGDDRGLIALSKHVRSGDPDNIEGRASRRYWPALFADPSFRRNRDADDCNRHLNYGYAILRAIVARAICAAGLHPSLGLHHHNRYDTFSLASDLMEPFRPLVDRTVALHARQSDPCAPLDKEAKRALLAALTGRLVIGDEERPLFDTAARTASSLAQVYAGQRKRLLLPEIL
jgi:CRISPR-associated protein Cas1